MFELIQWVLADERKRPISAKTLTYEKGVLTPEHWTDYEKSGVLAKATGYRRGVYLTENDPYIFFDIDNCVNPETGELTQNGADFLRVFQGAYIERSKSKTGFHVIGQCLPERMQEWSKGYKHRGPAGSGLEWYYKGRLCVLTGDVIDGAGDIIQNIGPESVKWITEKFPRRETSESANLPEDGPVPEWDGPEDDAKLIEIACKVQSKKSHLGGVATFNDLWNRNIEVLSKTYPPDKPDKEFNYSTADSALCAHLAFWTGKDQARIERLFDQSALVRDKWTERPDYRRSTIQGACAITHNVFGENNRNKEVEGIREGFQFMPVDKLVDYFEGFVYITAEDKIRTPHGLMLKQSQFKARYGGYVFALDATGDKTTPNAWLAFTESRAVNFTKVDATCFEPQESKRIIEREGMILLNTFDGFKTESKPGDVSLFLEHLKKLFPNDNDREIITSYMAALVQYPGIKFQWCPVIQGTEGNGKTFLARAMIHIAGRSLCHTPRAERLAAQFNGWMVGKVFAVVDEVKIAGRNDVLEAMKWIVSNEFIEYERKGIDQDMAFSVVNFILLTNYRDAIPLTTDMRRYAPLFCPQQTKADLNKWGMTGAYFKKLFDWANGGGWANIRYYLESYQIPEGFNPAVDCMTAPQTSSYVEALKESEDWKTTAIREMLGDEPAGMRGGWVSTIAMCNECKKRGLRISKKDVSDRLAELGYVLHPALPHGRLTGSTVLDGGKPKIYVNKEHKTLLLIDTPGAVRDRYLEDQNL